MDVGAGASTIQETTKAQSELRDSLANCGFFRDPVKYEPYLEGLMRSLAKRELLLGHYTHVTALTYASIGNAYRNLQEPRAVAMFRTQYRILRVLYGKTNGHITGALRELLQARGLSSSQIVGIKKDVFHSTRHELQGDSFRRFGQRQQALVEYHKAAHIEEISFGRDNPDLAYLWRKIAHLAAIENRLSAIDKKGQTTVGSPLLDLSEADRVGSNYLVETKIQLSVEARRCIDRGDTYFSLQLYSNAVGQYCMASSTTLSALAELPKEIFDLLSLDHPREERPSSHRSRRLEEPKKHRDTRSSRERKEVIDSDKQTLPTSQSSIVTTLTEYSRATQDKPKSETSSSARKKRSSRASSRSTSSFSSSHRRASKSNKDIISTNKVQPSSDSYLLKLARRTRRVASSSTKVATRQLRKGMSSRNLGDKESLRKEDDHNPKPSSSKTKKPSSKKESSYNTMPSPPMTPLVLGSPSQNSPQPSIESKDNNTGGLLKRFIPFRKHIKHNGSPIEDIASDETDTIENRSLSTWKATGVAHTHN